MSGILVRLDVREFINRLQGAEREVHAGIRSAIGKAARSARRQTIDQMAPDMNVPRRRAREATTLVKVAASGLSASWTISKARIGILATLGASIVKGAGLTASTWTLTGGGSAALSAPKAFTITGPNGGRAALLRIKHGPGTGHDPSALKSIFAEMSVQAMGVGDAAPRKFWERTAATEAVQRVSENLQAVLDGYTAPTDQGRD